MTATWLRAAARAAAAVLRAFHAVRFLFFARARPSPASGGLPVLRYERDGCVYAALCDGVDASRAVLFSTQCGSNRHLPRAARELLGPTGTGHHTRPSELWRAGVREPLELTDTMGRRHVFGARERLSGDARGDWDRESRWSVG